MGCGASKATDVVDAVEKKPEAVKDAPSASGVPTDATVIFVLGGPGTGKGAQCEKILAKCANCMISDT